MMLSALLMFSCSRGEEETSQLSMTISDNWEFRQDGDMTWLPATVPGTVHTDLLAAGKIEDPFYRLNEHDQQWIDKADWEYRTIFTAPELLL